MLSNRASSLFSFFCLFARQQQPVIDFAAGSVCAEPSIALQDAGLLCFHRKDVEKAVCPLAVDGYGEPTEDDNNNKEDDAREDDLGSFAKTPSTPFDFSSPEVESSAATAKEEKKEEPESISNSSKNNNEQPISATSAVVRGDRSWQDARDGESVSLCCGRCCSPLGFASLSSPETWRFWKHRLSVPKTATVKESKRTSDRTAMGTFLSSSLLLPFTNLKPLGSCSSFLARELVRYAESKAIFTFVVRCEENDDESYYADNETDGGTPVATTAKNNEKKCLLLRLLSWETAMATSFDGNDESSSSPPPAVQPRPSRRLGFRRVAKIVFEETIDPTALPKKGTAHGDNGSATQWFWGGVDLCCPPPVNGNGNGNAIPMTPADEDDENIKVSTVRLQLPREEYDRISEDLVSGKALFEKEMADATIMLKMGVLRKALGLTAVALG